MSVVKRLCRIPSRAAIPVAVIAILSATAPAAKAQTPPTGFSWQEIGARTFESTCRVCHQDNGQGIAGAFPPLTENVTALFAQPNGRGYLVRALLFGLTGPIIVNGTAFNSAMPPWQQLSDEEIAAVLDHVLTSFGNDQRLPNPFAPVLPSEVAAARAQPMGPAQVLALRALPGAPQAGVAASTPVTFTSEQVERGQRSYRSNCQDCHGTTLDNGEFGGPVLKGMAFRQKWTAGSVVALYSFTKEKMPPDRPGGLSPQNYVDLTAFILSNNGYQPGDKELPSDLDALGKMSLKP